MQEKVFEILSNREIAAGVWEIRLAGDTQGMERPGQFVNVSLPGFFLRRPISVCCVKGLLFIFSLPPQPRGQA